ncbi:M42 family metallopeptidase [candidate division KSB1 bacterium]|nr:M42 family metallopeptidase [candidate division KSB1 bacterium]
MNNNALNFLESLSNGFGPSGFEKEIIRLVKHYVEPFSDQLEQDRLGSLLFYKKGSSERPVIMLPGHVDEVGFVVSSINQHGFLTFNPVGGWFDQVLLGQRVLIRAQKQDIQGIIAAKPPHLMTNEERMKVIEKTRMFIDVGCSNAREAEEMGIRIGDPIMPISDFSVFTKNAFEIKNGVTRELGEKQLAIGKAFDDRIGAFIAAEVIRQLSEQNIQHPNTVVGVATTQEEVGARGARTAAWITDPDICITLEVDIAGDVPGIESHQALTEMGKGPGLLTFDSSLIPNQGLKEFIIDTAKKNNIPLQLSQMARGGTDAGMIHMTRTGCPSIVLGIPTRHIHSHVGILSLEDVEHCISLVTEIVKTLDTDVSESFTAI